MLNQNPAYNSTISVMTNLSSAGGDWWNTRYVYFRPGPWWRHQRETFSASLAFGDRNLPVPSQRPMTRSFDVFFDLHLKKGETNNRDAGDLRRHCDYYDVTVMITVRLVPQSPAIWKTLTVTCPVLLYNIWCTTRCAAFICWCHFRAHES